MPRGMSAVTPGLVCAHHHLYSALARGMPAPPLRPRHFGEILETGVPEQIKNSQKVQEIYLGTG